MSVFRGFVEGFTVSLRCEVAPEFLPPGGIRGLWAVVGGGGGGEGVDQDDEEGPEEGEG